MRFYLIHAFTDAIFSGNPAGVCVADDFPPDALMQRVAAENKVSETAFVVPRVGRYDIRWFTPEEEIDLCGHATLAAASVLLTDKTRRVEFTSMSGPLSAERAGGLIWLNFPARPGARVSVPEGLEDILGARISACYRARDLVAVLDSEETVATLSPDFARLAAYKDLFGVCVTARGTNCDFVSRYFAPGAGVPEDPVTGSSHCTLAPLWAGILGKNEMTAGQLSARGGALAVELTDDRVKIGGRAALYFSGELHI